MRYGLTPGFILRKETALKLVKDYLFQKKYYFIEIGSGSGNFLKELILKDYAGVGVDFSKEAVQYLKVKFKKYKKIKIIQKDFFHITGKFDLLITFEVIEHIKNDLNGFKKFNNLLKKNGYLLLSTPSLRKRWSYFDIVNGHYRRYEKQELKNKLINNGFKIISICSYGFPLLNLLFIFNKIQAKRIYKKLQKKGRIEKSKLTKQSGISGRKIYFILNIIINKWTLAPFNFIQRLFYHYDLGTGYVVLAQKVK